MRLHHVAVMTNDMEKSIEFYCKFLGLEIADRFMAGDTEVVFLTTGNTLLELIAPRELKGKKVEFNENVHIAFEPEDIEKAYEKIKAANVKLKTELSKAGKFTYCHFEGPNGETLEIIKSNN